MFPSSWGPEKVEHVRGFVNGLARTLDVDQAAEAVRSRLRHAQAVGNEMPDSFLDLLPMLEEMAAGRTRACAVSMGDLADAMRAAIPALGKR